MKGAGRSRARADTGADPRASGILLHPTSLPGPHGIGDLGPQAHRFLDFLSSAGQALWQVLPVGPTGYGDSPYACFSSFAGNPLLVSLETLAAWGLLSSGDLSGVPPFPPGRVDYGRVIAWKIPLLRAAARRLLERDDARDVRLDDSLRAFLAREAWWLEDYSLFIALKRFFEERARSRDETAGAWNASWDRDIALREPAAMRRWRKELERDARIESVIQFFFFRQWQELREAAAARGMRIIGDIPIFAAPDSADVWANRELFLLDGDGRPAVVSGVPPDYFAATGQLWGNPLYDWPALKRRKFDYWVRRIQAATSLYDYVRIDHFRGFCACWTVPAGEKTAENGRWEPALGAELFRTLARELGRLPLIAEDLGVITPDVNELRESLGFPGMRVLQFAFDAAEAGSLSADNRFLPHNHAADSVVYTGTHDNDTSRGWYAHRSPEERDYLARYCGSADGDVEWILIRMALSSVSRFAVVPLQDVLGLGSEARMNTPGTSGGSNWAWRFENGALAPRAAERLRAMSALYGRVPGFSS
ncbi:MAG TPA: 4-alpha-glucanotransferase [Spirochaetia bacterium]|nr:4-alpha-glucanotransferase [Spirochaetia bacterium]